MDETEGGAAVTTQLLWQLVGRFEHLAEKATGDAQDRYLKVAKLYRQRAEAIEQRRQPKNSS